MKHGYTPVMPDGDTNYRSKDNAIYGFLLFCGIVGLVYFQIAVRNAPVHTVENSVKNTYQITTPDPGPEQASTLAAPSLPKSTEKLFVETDVPEVGYPLEFKISNADSRVSYELDFGNGTRKAFQNGRLTHKFKKVGEVKVSLFMTYNGQRRFIQDRTLRVAPAVEVDAAADAIEFSSGN